MEQSEKGSAEVTTRIVVFRLYRILNDETAFFSLFLKYSKTELIRWVRAIEDFIAQTDHDLGFVQGDHIQLLKFADENWGVGRLQGTLGIIFS